MSSLVNSPKTEKKNIIDRITVWLLCNLIVNRHSFDRLVFLSKFYCSSLEMIILMIPIES